MPGGAVPVWKKYTTGSRGIWEKIRCLLVVAPNRSSGNPYVPYYRVPTPGSNPTNYISPKTVPAGDIVGNEYYKKDTRRAYPRLSAFSQGKIGGLLVVGNAENSRLVKGEEGVKQLATVSEEDKVSLSEVLKTAPTSVINGEILGKNGEPVIAPNLNKKFSLTISPEEVTGMYSADYPCRMFSPPAAKSA